MELAAHHHSENSFNIETVADKKETKSQQRYIGEKLSTV